MSATLIERLRNFIQRRQFSRMGEKYRPSLAWLLACLSELAYISNRSRLQRSLNHLGLGLEAAIDVKGSQAIVVCRPKQFVVIAFRGVEINRVRDLITVIKAHMTKGDNGGKVHSGFYHAFYQLQEKTEQCLQQRKFQKLPIFLCGHSLGGALATVAARDFTFANKITACYTYGSPRVGNSKWNKAIQPPIYRLVNAADSISYLPPEWRMISMARFVLRFLPVVGTGLVRLLSIFIGYQHAGQAFFLSNCPKNQYSKVQIAQKNSLPLVAKSLYLYLSIVWNWKRTLREHKIKVYRKKLAILSE